MKIFLAFALVTAGFCAQSRPLPPSSPFTDAPTAFIENIGQVVDQRGARRTDIDYKISGGGVQMFVGAGGLHYQFNKSTTACRVDVELVGGKPDATHYTSEADNYVERYYGASFGSNGATAKSFRRITYRDVYPFIDWVVYLKDGQVEYDFVVRPGGRVQDIRLKYGGVTSLTMTEGGALEATTPLGTLEETAPIAYNRTTGATVPTRFAVNGFTVSFVAEAPAEGLVIDPQLSWSTYYGVSLVKLTCDVAGNVYGCGTTNAANLATTGAHQTTVSGSADAFVVKFNAAGQRVWATYFGGSAGDTSSFIFCKGASLYLAGSTVSTSSVATPNAYQTTIGGSADGFLVKFDTAGVRHWATYLGGSNSDVISAIAVTANDTIFVCGDTRSTSGIATPTSFQPAYAAGGPLTQCFLAKFDPTGARIWGTYYAGSTSSPECVTDSTGNVFLSGGTATPGYGTAGTSYPAIVGGADFFLAKFTSNGARLWHTYVGSTQPDYAPRVATDGANAYISGQYSFNNSLTTNALFVAKFNPNGVIQWSQLPSLGSFSLTASMSYNATINRLCLIGAGGFTGSMATPGAYKTTAGTEDALLLMYEPTNGAKTYGTYFGGPHNELGSGIAIDAGGNIYFSGTTSSNSFNLSTPGAYQTSISNAFLAKFSACTSPLPSIVGDSAVCPNTTHTYSIFPIAGATSYTWVLPQSWTGTSSTTSIAATAGGASGNVVIFPIDGCAEGIPLYVSVAPFSNISVNGTLSMCPNQTRILFTQPHPNATFQWNLNGSPIAGATNDSLTVSTGGSYTVSVFHPLHNCTNSTPPVVINAFPNNPPVIAVNGNSLSTGTNFVYYYWYKDGAPFATQTDTVTIAQNGTYTVLIVDTNGCTIWSNPVVVCSFAPPGVGLISGTSNVCPGQTVVYSVAQVPGATSYTWTLPAGWSGSSTTNSISVLVGPSSNNTISVVAQLPCGPTAPSTKPLGVPQQPTISVNGDSVICTGDTAVLSVSPFYSTYSWKLNGMPIAGGTNAALPVTSAGSYTVTVTTQGIGCILTTVPRSIAIAPPVNPVITISGATLSTGTYASYQWLLNGDTIVGATGATYNAVQDGTYQVVVSDSFGCAGLSNTVVVANTEIGLVPSQAINLSVTPNPNPGHFTLKGNVPFAGRAVLVEGFNTVGQLIQSGQHAVSSGRINIPIDWSHLAPGMYYLKVSTGGSSTQLKVNVVR